jgi:hypothetical protein
MGISQKNTSHKALTTNKADGFSWERTKQMYNSWQELLEFQKKNEDE